MRLKYQCTGMVIINDGCIFYGTLFCFYFQNICTVKPFEVSTSHVSTRLARKALDPDMARTKSSYLASRASKKEKE